MVGTRKGNNKERDEGMANLESHLSTHEVDGRNDPPTPAAQSRTPGPAIEPTWVHQSHSGTPQKCAKHSPVRP